MTVIITDNPISLSSKIIFIEDILKGLMLPLVHPEVILNIFITNSLQVDIFLYYHPTYY